MARLEAELRHLFGADVAEQSKSLSAKQVFAEVDVMPSLADEMIKFNGNPKRQRKFIQSMSKGKAIALCYWLREV